MLKLRRHRWGSIALAVLLIAAIVAGTVWFTRDLPLEDSRKAAAEEKEAPPDLEKLREPYRAGVEALQRNDGPEAVRVFSSFDFGSRSVEEYRLYYLANGYQLAGNLNDARLTLARLWRRTPRLVYSDDVAFSLADLYAQAGDTAHSADVYAGLARRTDVPAVAAAARWSAAMRRLEIGDVSGALYSARNITIHNPRSAEAKHAAALVRALTGTADADPIALTPSERLDRVAALSAAGDPQTALEELEAMRVPPQVRNSVQLQKGITLHLLKRYQDSNKVLEPLTSGPYKYAIPALRYAARNYSILAASIDPNVEKTVKERKKVGTIKQRVGKGKKRRTVTKPRYQTVFRKVKLVDLEKKKQKEEYERLGSERLKDLLQLPIDENQRLETLTALIARAEAKSQDDYLQELVPQVIRIDAQADPALQHFWDKGWAAYQRGDLAGAGKLFRFISETYTHVNVRRQSEYWYARAVERQGQKEEAAAIYRKLASAPYMDLYAQHAVKRGAPHQENRTNPLEVKGREDWRQFADREMPEELRLAWELSSLGAVREAYLEVRRNLRRGNTRFAEALMAEYHQAGGNEVLMYRSLRRAWPQLATVEQDSVPTYFLRMYYPLEHGEHIEKLARERGLDANLVRGLILQESYYDPTAKSRVGATGLMQLMPPTAAEHARRLRIPFAVSRLENPRVNIELGTFHLKMLMNMFKGETTLAVASYNAGQGNVLKWRRAAPAKPLDEFLESIPFQETRNYVKRVTMLRSAYSRLTL